MANPKIKELYFTGYNATDGKSNFSRVVVFGNRRFKLTCEVGNSFCCHKIYVMSADGVFVLVATDIDIKELTHINYVSPAVSKVQIMRFNMPAMEKWITSVYAI